jgi:hypothetical protein
LAQLIGKSKRFWRLPATSREWTRVLAGFYLVGVLADFGYRMATATEVGDLRLTWNDAIVGFEASLFWPADLAVRWLAGG